MNENIIVKIKSPTILKKASTDAAGYDLYADLNQANSDIIILQPHERHLFKTGIFLEIPSGVYGRIAPRSGLAYKQGINVLAGVIDADYRGEVGVILHNTSDTPITLDLNKAIAQIIFEKCYTVDFIDTNELSSTQRGEGGYGHTDKK